MCQVLIPVLVAGGAAGLAGFVLPLPAAVAVALIVSNVVGEYLQSKRVREPMSWQRALTKGLVAGTVAFGVLSLLES
jgi:hypothetical protein